jgi:hypothetical protein
MSDNEAVTSDSRKFNRLAGYPSQQDGPACANTGGTSGRAGAAPASQYSREVRMMGIWFDISLGLGTGKNVLIRSAHTVVRKLREARIEPSRPRYSETSHQEDVVWRRTSPMEDLGRDWVPHRVIRRTPQTVLVEALPAVPSDSASGNSTRPRRRTYWLNRQDLERLGVARVRSRSIVFFTRPDVSDEAVSTVRSLVRLGLWFPFSEKDLRGAYIRRASLHHPDAGGSNEKFIQLQDDHARAMAVLNLPVNTEKN